MKQERTSEQALLENGLTGDRLLKLARRIATDAQRRAPSGLGGKYEDLVSFLVLQALEAAMRYDPCKSAPGYTFSSWICDIMERRVTDWYRRKSEGFGDSRSGSNGRIILTGDQLDDQPADDYELELDHDQAQDDTHIHTTWARAAGFISTPMHDWDRINEAVVMDWVRASQARGLPFDEWVRRTLDLAARNQLRSAA